MSIENYIVENDKFEDEGKTDFAFPCNACAHRHKYQDEEPCASCGHNVNTRAGEQHNG
jgi:rRNA maturation endonuclease Nob1